jgi:hypothetical protein
LYENYRHHEIRSLKTDEKLELDIFLPKENLAFEYHGEHHYLDVYGLGNHWERTEWDKNKREACSMQGITLIEVPYWWDLKLGSLAATIRQQRDDLIVDNVGKNPIPNEPSRGFLIGKFQLTLIIF